MIDIGDIYLSVLKWIYLPHQIDQNLIYYFCLMGNIIFPADSFAVLFYRVFLPNRKVISNLGTIIERITLYSIWFNIFFQFRSAKYKENSLKGHCQTRAILIPVFRMEIAQFQSRALLIFKFWVKTTDKIISECFHNHHKLCWIYQSVWQIYRNKLICKKLQSFIV